MNRAVLVACGVLIVACTGAWSSPALAVPSPCATGATCASQVSPNAQRVPGGPMYTVTKSASRSGHVRPGQTVKYTVTVTANADVTGASFKDDLHDNVLDDATWGGFANAHGANYDHDDDVVSWVDDSILDAGQTVRVSYSVIVDDPDTGDGVLRNSVEPGERGECGTCAITNAVESEFSVRETGSPKQGSTIHPGDSVTYTIRVTAGDAPAYAGVTDKLGPLLEGPTRVRVTGGHVSVDGSTLQWAGSIAAGDSAKVTFSAEVKQGSGSREVTNTVQPASSDPYTGRCVSKGACRLSYTVLALPDTDLTTSASAGGPSRAEGAAAEGPGPTTSLPHIADTGAKTAGLSQLAALLLLGGLGLLLLGRAPRRRPRHRH